MGVAGAIIRRSTAFPSLILWMARGGQSHLARDGAEQAHLLDAAFPAEGVGLLADDPDWQFLQRPHRMHTGFGQAKDLATVNDVGLKDLRSRRNATRSGGFLPPTKPERGAEILLCPMLCSSLESSQELLKVPLSRVRMTAVRNRRSLSCCYVGAVEG